MQNQTAVGFVCESATKALFSFHVVHGESAGLVHKDFIALL